MRPGNIKQINKVTRKNIQREKKLKIYKDKQRLQK